MRKPSFLCRGLISVESSNLLWCAGWKEGPQAADVNPIHCLFFTRKKFYLDRLEKQKVISKDLLQNKSFQQVICEQRVQVQNPSNVQKALLLHTSHHHLDYSPTLITRTNHLFLFVFGEQTDSWDIFLFTVFTSQAISPGETCITHAINAGQWRKEVKHLV